MFCVRIFSDDDATKCIHSFIHSFERERKRGKSLVSRRGLSSPRAQTKTKKKRNETRFFFVVVVVVLLLKRQQKRERARLESTTQRNTFFPSVGFERDDFSTQSHTQSPTKKKHSLKACSIYLRFRHRRRRTPRRRLRKAVVFFSFFFLVFESRRHRRVFICSGSIIVRANSLSLFVFFVSLFFV